MRIEGQLTIAAPPGTVFEVVADSRNEPRYNPRIAEAVKTSAGPVGAGTTFLARPRGGRGGSMTVRVVQYDPPRRLGTSVRSASMSTDGGLDLTPVPGGTRLRWSWDLRLRGAARLLTPLVALTGSRWERRNWVGLRDYLEASPS